MLPVNATVRRDGSSQKISAEAVMPGDIVLLEAGDSVCADGRLIVAEGLEIDESTLTGESQPAAKQCALPVAVGLVPAPWDKLGRPPFRSGMPYSTADCVTAVFSP